MPRKELRPGSPINKPVKEDIPEEDLEYSPIRVTIAIIILIILISGAAYGISLIWPEAAADCGYDRVCFVFYADDCQKAVLREEVTGGTIIKYQSSSRCTVTKSIETFGTAEPEEVVDAFKGKKMVCSYERNNFDPLIAEGISLGLNYCQGELRDAIIDLRSALLE